MNPDKLVNMLESALAGNTVSLKGMTRDERKVLFRGEPTQEDRLQQLLSKFELAREAYLEFKVRCFAFDPANHMEPIRVVRSVGEHRPELCEIAIEIWAVPDWRDPVPETNLLDEASLAARRYIIARDFNEFDPDRALMLWKLQNGGAQ